jgi:hypothetical protein
LEVDFERIPFLPVVPAQSAFAEPAPAGEGRAGTQGDSEAPDLGLSLRRRGDPAGMTNPPEPSESRYLGPVIGGFQYGFRARFIMPFQDKLLISKDGDAESKKFLILFHLFSPSSGNRNPNQALNTREIPKVRGAVTGEPPFSHPRHNYPRRTGEPPVPDGDPPPESGIGATRT